MTYGDGAYGAGEYGVGQLPDAPAGPPTLGQVDLRLRAYVPNGASLGLLPAPDEFNFAIPLNDVPSLTVNYGVRGPRGDLLGQPLELAVEISANGGRTWAEPNDCRFLYLRDGRDPIRTADTWAVEAPGYLWRLQKARVLDGGLAVEGRRTFEDKTPGFIFATLWAEAQARGALAGMTLQGGGAADASGGAWSVTLTRSYELGADLLTVLMDLSAAGYLDFRTVGRSVAIYAPDTTLATDRTVGAAQVQLTPLQVTESPFRRSWEGLADFIQVAGDEGATVGITNPAAQKPWGRWEDYVTQGGVSDEGTLTAIGERYQALTESARAEFTHALALGVGPAPLADFWPGDYVWSRGMDGSLTRYRVRQVTLQKEGNTVQGNVVVNDRFLENDIKTRRMLDAILGGASPTGSTGGPVTPPGPDILAPAAVTSLTASSAFYTGPGGAPVAQITLNWPDVTTNADGTPMSDLAGYQVRRRQPALQWAVVATAVVDSLWTSSPYDPGTVWQFQVRAVDASGNEGAWSPVETITAAADNVPPAQPSAPTVTSRMGVARAVWDGLDANGNAMAGDLAYVEIHYSSATGFVPVLGNAATMVVRLTDAGYGLVPLPYGTAHFFRIVAVDTSGNISTPSAQSAATVTPLVNTDLIGEIIDGANITHEAIGAEHIVASESLAAKVGMFLELSAGMFSANLVEADFINFGSLNGELVTGLQLQTSTHPTTGTKFKNTGIEAFDGTLRTFYVDAATGNVAVTGVGAIIEAGAPNGPRVRMSTINNPMQSGQQWGLLEFYSGNALWAPSRLWALYDGAGTVGSLQMSAPYRLSDGTAAAARLELGAGVGGIKYLRAVADSFYFGSSGTPVDLWLEGTTAFQLRTGTTYLAFNGSHPGSGFGAWGLVARLNGNPRTMAFDAANYLWKIGTARDVTMGSNFSFPASPIMVDGVADIGFTLRDVSGGQFEVVGAFGNNYKPIKAFSFIVSSDENWKAAIRKVPTGKMLEEVLAWETKEYGVKGFRPTKDRTRGLIAQQVREHTPMAVSGEDGNLGVDQYVALATVVGALQEIHARIEKAGL